MTIINLEDQCKFLLGEIEKSCRKAAMTREQIKRLKSKALKKEKEAESVTQVDVIEEENEEDDFEDEVNFYLTDYRNLPEDFTKEDLIAILPKRKNYNYQKILYRLYAESVREMKDLQEIILENESVSLEELKECRSLLDIEKRKIAYLQSFLRKQETPEEEKEELEANQLVLVPTPSGRPRILDELEHIPSDFYPGFLDLIRSIEDGTFKGVKKFINNRTLAGISEVKDFKIRVVFTRLNRNTYALITGFVKKTNSDKYYQESLCNKVKEYLKVEDTLKRCLDSEEFMSENQSNVDALYRLLSNSNTDETENKRGNAL